MPRQQRAEARQPAARPANGADAQRRRRVGESDGAQSQRRSAKAHHGTGQCRTRDVGHAMDRVSKALARASAATGTSRGSSARIPAMVSGLVSENRPTSPSSTGAVAQPRRSTAINAITHAALATMSTVIAQTEPNGSMSAPARGLMARPGATAANASHPARTGDPVRQRIEHNSEREHASRQTRQQSGEQQRAYVGRAEKLAVGGRVPCHCAERSDEAIPIEYAAMMEIAS